MRLGYWAAVIAVFCLAVIPISDVGPPGSDKFEHFGAFLALGIGGGLVYSRSPMWMIGALLVAYGGGIELVQGLPVVNRDCSLYDWLADIGGVAVSAILLTLSGLRRRVGLDKPKA
jgi:hypothetical protein